MWEAFGTYGHDTKYKAEYFKYDYENKTYELVPVEFWFGYVSNTDYEIMENIMYGALVKSTAVEIYVEGNLEIDFQVNDRVLVHGATSPTKIYRVSRQRTNRKGLRSFDFQPTGDVRRILTLS